MYIPLIRWIHAYKIRYTLGLSNSRLGGRRATDDIVETPNVLQLVLSETHLLDFRLQSSVSRDCRARQRNTHRSEDSNAAVRRRYNGQHLLFAGTSILELNKDVLILDRAGELGRYSVDLGVVQRFELEPPCLRLVAGRGGESLLRTQTLGISRCARISCAQEDAPGE